MSSAALVSTTARPADLQPRVVAVAAGAALALSGAAWSAGGWRQAALALVGLFAGLALYHASFGFASSWRRFAFDRRSLGVRAQIVMIGLAIMVFYPALSHGALFGQPVDGFVMPVGLALGFGAFVFGAGMQLAGGCGSGTLYTVGGGSLRMVATLAAFIAGSLLATADPLGWRAWPDIGAHSIVKKLGAPIALVLTLVALALAYGAALAIERARHGSAEPVLHGARRGFLRGPWPILVGALALALVNVATLALAGRPWGITSGFALWGAKFAAATGIPVAAWPYWQGEAALAQSVFADVTSVMNFGIMLGALLAAGLAGAFAPVRPIPARSLAAAILGGLLMGFGARLATGCNVGGFFSGVASGSLHGFVWLFCAIPGVLVGARLRPKFGLDL